MGCCGQAIFNWVAVRDGLKSVLEAIPAIRIVHGFPRVDDQKHIARWRERFTPDDSPVINAWVIERGSIATAYRTGQAVTAETTVNIYGFYGHNDETASQDIFDAIVDDVMAALMKSFRLFETVEIQGPAQLIVEDIRVLAGTFVHYAQIETIARQCIDVNQIQ